MSAAVKRKPEAQALLEVLGLGHLRRVTQFTVEALPGEPLQGHVTTIPDIYAMGEVTQLYAATLAREQPKPKREPFDLDTACMRAQGRIAIGVMQSAARHLDEMASYSASRVRRMRINGKVQRVVMLPDGPCTVTTLEDAPC